MANVPYLQALQISGPKFAVQPEVKKRKLPRALFNLKSYPDSPDVFESQWSLLANDLSFIPRNLGRCIGCSVHNDLLDVEGRTTVDRLCK